MALTASALTGLLERAWSSGEVKIEIQSYTAVSGDTSGTATAKQLDTVYAALVINGVALTGVPTVSGKTATFAFANPGANRAGHIIFIGA